MSSVFDYLDLRGNVLFSEDPFNEVDNLILSLLAYADFEGVEGIEQSFLKVKDVHKRYFELHTREEILSRKTFTKEAPFLLDKLVKSQRFNGLEMGLYTNVINKEDVVQISAITFKLNDMIFISFRGTDSTFVGWKEDLYFSYMSGTFGQIYAVRYLEKISKMFSGNIHVGGHSKGGNFAIYASTFCKKDIQDKIVKIWANDSPGFTEDVILSKEFMRIRDKIYLILPEFSVIGMLMNNPVVPHIVLSDSMLVLQHNAFSWKISGNRFESTYSISKQAVFIDKAIKSWWKEIAQEDKKKAIDSIFYCIECAEIDTVSDFQEESFLAIKKILKAANNLPEEESKLIKRLGTRFISNGSTIVVQGIKHKVSEKNPIKLPKLKRK